MNSTAEQTSVLLVTRNFPPTIGGMETYSNNLYNELKSNIPVCLLANRMGKPGLLPFFLKSIFIILVRGRRFNCIHFCDGALAPLAYFAKVVTSAQVSITIHALDITYPNKLYQLVIPYLISRTDQVVCVSKYSFQECVVRNISEGKCRIIPNGIDFDRLQDVRDSNCANILRGISAPKSKILLSVGRLVKRKGHAWFIKQVMPKLPDEYVFVIAGTGKESKNIEKSIRENKLSSRVIMIGSVTETQKICLYKAAHLFIMSNIVIKGDTEGFGISLIEAGAYGLPSVASNIQGIRSAVLPDQTGALVAAEKPDGFIHAIMTKNLSRKKVAGLIKDNFNWKTLVLDYVKMFDNSA